MSEKLQRFKEIAKYSGWRAAILKLLHYLLRVDMNSVEASRKLRKIVQWEVNSRKIAEHLAYRKKNLKYRKLPTTIHWILPRLSAGSGGHRTATRMMRHLSEQGYAVTVWIYDPRAAEIPHIKTNLERFYGLTGVYAHPLVSPDDIEADVLVATDAWTALAAASAVRVLKKFYFVQDYEPLFHEAGSLSVLLDYTYSLGFHPITAGPWLQELLKSKFDLKADSFNLACDHEIYNKREKQEPKIPTVIFYARANTARRCVELGLAALELLKRRMPEVSIILFGFEGNHKKLPFNAEVYGIISPVAIAKLYSRSTVGLSLSATNHSLIPNEMMACGLPVVELKSPNNTTIYPKGTVIFADAHPAMIAESIEHLLEDHMTRRIVSQKSQQYAQLLTWENAAKKVEVSILKNFAKD